MYKQITASIILILYVVSLNLAYAEQFEDEVAGFVKEGIGDIADGLTDDIDFSKDNFLNITEKETFDIKNSGRDVLDSTINLFLSVKSFAKDGVKLISPYEISEFLLWIIAFAFAILFILSITKAIGKHIFIMIIIGLTIVALFVVLGL